MGASASNVSQIGVWIRCSSNSLLLKTQSMFPSSVFSLTENPRGSLALQDRSVSEPVLKTASHRTNLRVS